MGQQTLREFNNNTFSVEEAAEWHGEFKGRTDSDQDGYDSIDRLATKVKGVESNKQNSIGEGGISTAMLADDAVTGSKIADNAVGSAQIDADSVGASELKVSENGADGQILKSNGDGTFSWVDTPTLSIDDNSISHAKLANEFKGKSTLTPAATVNVDFAAASVFRLTPNGNTVLNFTNPRIGVKTIVLIGDGTAHGISFSIASSAGTPSFHRISGEFAGEAGAKYLVSLQCTDDGTDEEIWYTISEPA